MLVSVLVVAGAVLSVVYAPQLGWNDAPSWGWDLLNFGPETSGAVAGSGVVQTESRRVADFNAISVEYPAEITIRQGSSESLEIEAEEEPTAAVKCRVRNGTLYLENSKQNWRERVDPREPVLISITVKDLNKVQFPTAGKLMIKGLKTDSLSISVSGAGDVTLTEVTAGVLEFSLSGAGNIVADGKSDSLRLQISGLGNFKGGDLQSQDADVQISGAGSATVWVESTLNASISGAGSIDYYGDPVVNERISGVGSVRKARNK